MRRIRQISALLVGLMLVGLATGDHALAQADKKTIKIGMLQMLTGTWPGTASRSGTRGSTPWRS